MELHTASHEKIRALMAKGVRIPNPATLDIGDEVQTDHISGDNVTIYPGCRIYGKKTVISSGCRLGYEAPVTIDNCLLGPSVELKGGFFTGSVFLEKASMGSGAQIREGCLLEEEASGAHCVGLKQTILFPFVTLGSLINFCDCLMAGGTSRRDHSEVGSSYIHFNFTPDGDKATPSLFGDVPKGVMLNQRPIFLGGQGGAVGPLQVGYGNVTAAGSILRKSYPGENQLIFEAGPSRSVRIDRGLPYLEINHLVEQNVIYLANLKALAAWYKSVRKSFFEHQESGRLIYEGAIELISGACRERLSRLERMARNALAAAPESAKAEREELVARLPELEEQLYRDEDGGETQLARQEFFALWEQARPGENLPYTEAIRKLPPEVAAAATVWLSSIVDDYCNKARAAFPLLQIFKNAQLQVNKMGELFGTDGIRGVANRYPMDAETAFKVGQTIAYLFRRNGHRAKVVIGKDTRISGYMLESSLEAGITSMGGDAYLVGVLPTPGISYITHSMRADAGIVISASHNPYQDNGLKIFGADGFKLTDAREGEIEDMILGNKLNELLPEARHMGKATRIEDVNGRYIVFLKNTFPRDLSMEGMKIVLDAANGATYRVAPDTFSELGVDLQVINGKPDGININHRCGSQHTQDLRAKVLESGAALGLAFDGDGDRLIAVDEKGREITGDQMLVICACAMKREGRLAGNLLVTTVMSNLGLRVACKKYGIDHYASQVGDRYVLEDMLRLGALIGGEDSGHMIFLEHHKTGDGIIAAMQLIAAMLKENKPLSELARLMDVFPQKLVNVEVKSKPDIEDVPRLIDAIRQAEGELGEEGRILVRYSGTQNICRVMVEGPTDEVTARYARTLADIVKEELA